VTTPASSAIQDRYPSDFTHCYGCGRSNEHGLQLKSRREGDDVVARFTPAPQHVSVPGFAYGGLVASLVDCHAMATAADQVERETGAPAGAEATRFVTASLKVDFLKPTPLGGELVLVGRVTETGRRKRVVSVRVLAAGEETARGEVVAVPIPAAMAGGPAGG